MRRSLAKLSESEASNHTPSLADFTTTTPELKFSVHTAGKGSSKGWRRQSRYTSFVNAVGGPGSYERRSDADKKMNLDNVASYQADATTKRPRPVFTCEMAKAISAPTLLFNGERSPKFFHLIMDQLESCLPNRERIVVAGSSHTVPSEKPDAYNQAVLAFLGKH